MELETEILISLVYDRSVLWDKSRKEYKNRNLTRSSWESVCQILDLGSSSNDEDDILKYRKLGYDDIVEFWETQSRQDPNYFIFAGFGTSMTLHFRNGKWKEIPTYDFPDMVYHAQARMYAMTIYGYTIDTGEVEWVLYQACDEDFAWIEIAQWVIKANRLHEVNQIIDDFLGSNLLGVPQMVKLITVLPFKV